MCVIVAKEKGIKMPDKNILKTCFNHNPDGAGIMWNQENAVNIRKGFMDWKSFDNFLDELSEQVDLKKSGVCMHFRIKTHGKTSPQNCHGFPISNRIKDLKKLEIKTDVGVMHNGIIPIKPIYNLSDTQTYILKRLYNIKKHSPGFLKEKYIMSQIEKEINSKMAFLTSDGSIYTIGEFIESGSILYSNRSFEEYSYYGFNWYEYDNYFYSKIDTDYQKEYIQNLKYFAALQGIDEKVIDYLLENGVSLEEIEEYIYER